MPRMNRWQLLELVVTISKLRTTDLTFVLQSAQGELARREKKAEEKGKEAPHGS